MAHTESVYCVRHGESNSIASLILRWLPYLLMMKQLAIRLGYLEDDNLVAGYSRAICTACDASLSPPVSVSK